MKSLNLLLCICALSPSAIAEIGKDPVVCEDILLDRDTMKIVVYNSRDCDWVGSNFGNGYIIAVIRDFGPSKVIFSHFEYSYVLKYYRVVLDDSGPAEVLTLFQDESSTWGHIHRIKIDDSNQVKIQTIEIPQFFGDDTRIRPYVIHKDNGIYFDGYTMDGYMTEVSYDSIGDSLVSSKIRIKYEKIEE